MIEPIKNVNLSHRHDVYDKIDEKYERLICAYEEAGHFKSNGKSVEESQMMLFIEKIKNDIRHLGGEI